MLLAADTIAAAPIVIFMGCGVLVAIFGHIVRSRTLVVGGITILFIATLLMFVSGYAAYQNDEVDPRPPCGETVKECEKEGEGS